MKKCTRRLRNILKRKSEYRLLTREDILDNMGSEELAANLFRITQTESRLKRDKVDTERKACDTHNKIGKIVRKAIIKRVCHKFIL